MTVFDNCLFEVISSPLISEKSSFISKKNNTVVLKVNIKSNKSEIKNAVQKFLSVRVKEVNTLIIKGKLKKHKNKITIGKSWKKAYVILEKGENFNFINDSNK
ncbi:50S ribosomal protein L23 [Buchnera aphidicola (Tetraneura ulmi)]|uniref:50S ribosomal protein L23 n=1 Tax=Buchnera aphidicola TaxID=9 RepID=UPI0034639CCB